MDKKLFGSGLFLTNQWYRFADNTLKQKFLAEAISNGGRFASETKMDAECYNFKTYSSSKRVICYKTKYADYPDVRDIITYTAEPAETTSVRCIKMSKIWPLITEAEEKLIKQSKKENKNMDAMINTIKSFKQKRRNEICDKATEAEDEAMKSAEAMKALSKAVEIINKNLEGERSNKLQATDILSFSMLSVKELAKLHKIDEDKRSALSELDRTLTELEELLAIADTFEQKEELLVRYGILKK